MISLLILLPVLLLLLSGLGIALLKQFRPSIGYSWIWATVIAIAALGLVLFLRFRLPAEVIFDQWRPYGNVSQVPIFTLDYASWPYALSLAALLLAVMLTDSARLHKDSGPISWVVCLSITGLGLLAVLAGSPLTLVLTWSAIDLVELMAVFGTRSGRWASEAMIMTFAVRVAGTLLVIMTILLSRAWNLDFSMYPIPPRLAAFMLLAVGLRLGVLPLNLPFIREVYAWRGLGNLLRMVGPASGLMVLARMPADAVPLDWQPIFLFFSALAAVYGSAMWLAASPSETGRPYWVIALSALAVACVIRGNPQASIPWGVTLVLIGAVLFLFSAQNRRILYIPFLAVAGLLGLPFTPTALGLQGLIGPAFDFYGLMFVLSMMMLSWGFIRRVFAPQEELYVMERWIQTVYPLGLLLLVVAQWVTEASYWRIAFIPGLWWISAALTLTSVGVGWFVVQRRLAFSADPARLRWVVVFGQRLGNSLSYIFRLNWLYQFIGLVYVGIQSIIQLLTAIFEGDGGVLWALVMLALLISLLVTGGTR